MQRTLDEAEAITGHWYAKWGAVAPDTLRLIERYGLRWPRACRGFYEVDPTRIGPSITAFGADGTIVLHTVLLPPTEK